MVRLWLMPKIKFIISRDSDQSELKGIEDIINAQATAQRINTNKAPWIYKLDKESYEKLTKKI
jgi:hypothetical protein